MKKIIRIAGKEVIVATVEELRALDLTIAQSVEAYNDLFGAGVKKFSDKNAAAKRLFAILPEYTTPVKAAPKKAAPKKAATTRPDGVKAILRKLYSDPNAAYTGAELEALTNATYKVLHDDLARLKHPTYAGKAGTLTLVRVGTLYVKADSDKYLELLAIGDCASVSPAGEPC